MNDKQNISEIQEICDKYSIPNIRTLLDLEKRTTISITNKTLLYIRKLAIGGESTEKTLHRVLGDIEQNNGGE